MVIKVEAITNNNCLLCHALVTYSAKSLYTNTNGTNSNNHMKQTRKLLRSLEKSNFTHTLKKKQTVTHTNHHYMFYDFPYLLNCDFSTVVVCRRRLVCQYNFFYRQHMNL